MYTTGFVSKENAIRRGSHDKSFPSIPFILAVILTFTAVSCGGGSAPTSGAPVANTGGPYLGNANQALAFNGSRSSAPNGKSLTSFAWIFGDGGSATGASVTHTYTVAGNYTATLTVTDNSGATDSSSVVVEIITAPVAKPGGPYTGKVGVAVSINGTASTPPPRQALGFSWNFGDGATATGATPTHTYGSICTCIVTLTVTDDTAGTSVGTTTATIATGPGPSGESATPSTFFAIGPAANASSQFAYTLTSSSNAASSLSIETIDTATGKLSPAGLAAPSLDSQFVPSGMIADPSRKFLYLYGGNTVLTFSIASGTGELIPSVPTATDGGVGLTGDQILIFNPNAKFAFFITHELNGGDASAPGSITRFSVDPATGVLGAIETVSAQVRNPQAAAIDPGGNFLYVSGVAPVTSSDATSVAPQIAIFAVAPGTGALTPVSESPISIESGIAATSISIDSTGRFMYAAGRNSTANSASLSVFTIASSTGEIVESSPSLPLGSAIADASSIALSPSANFGYVLTIPSRTETAVHQSVKLFQWDARTGAPAIGNGAIENDISADRFTPPVGNLILFSPNSVTSTNTATPDHTAFIFFANSPSGPAFGYSIDLDTGSVSWLPGVVSSTGR